MAKKDYGIPEKRSDFSEVDINREKRSGAAQPGRTPGAAEGQDEKRDKPYPDPGKTPGKAEG
jgi:hypothetical protein